MSHPAPTPTTAPGGWYPDPTAPGMTRWWTGNSWGTQVRPAADDADELGFIIPTRSSLGTRAVVWGAISLVLNPVFLPSILAIVYSAIALHDASRVARSGGLRPPTGRAKLGLILGIAGIVLAVVAVVALQLLMHRAGSSPSGS